MGKLSTHILDTSLGTPASGLKINLYQRQQQQSVLIKTVLTNQDGRCDEPLLSDGKLLVSGYELEFMVADYFSGNNIKSPFLKEVIIRFYVSNVDENYHVPLLISPFSYSTYRGS